MKSEHSFLQTFSFVVNNRKGFSSTACFVVSFVLLLFSACYYYSQIASKKISLEEAEKLFSQGKYEEGRQILKKIEYSPDAAITLRESFDKDNQEILKGKYIQAETYLETRDYSNATTLFRQLGLYNDSHLRALYSLKRANGDPLVIREAEIFDFKTIFANQEEEKEALRKSVEELERIEAAKEAELEKQKLEAIEARELEMERIRIEQEEAIRLKEAEKRALHEEEMNRIEGIRAEEERIAKEKEKRRAAMKVTLGDNKVISVNGYDISLIACPEGSFWMGSPENELGRNSDEILHLVTISQGFYIGKYEVTQGLYKAVTGMNPARSFIKGDYKPVYQVSWFMANEFCEKLNKLTKGTRPAQWHFDLPTEAQWEYACRAGYGTAFNNGGYLLPNNANCPALAQAGWYAANTPARQLSDVGYKQPNFWLIHDMHGGVWEWCKDYYGDYPSKPVLNPCQLDGYKKVLRGGSIRCQPKDCRSASRRSSVPGNDGNGEYDIGFRLVLVPDSYEKTFQADK